VGGRYAANGEVTRHGSTSARISTPISVQPVRSSHIDGVALCAVQVTLVVQLRKLTDGNVLSQRVGEMPVNIVVCS
jgi:hypothetical protein